MMYQILVLAVNNKCKAEKEQIILRIAQKVVSRLVDLSVGFAQSDKTSKDHVFEYAQEVVSLGLLFLDFRDAIKEGDGERIMLCWKYFLPLFKCTNRRNYAIEAFHTLASRKLLPHKLAHQLVWSWCINTHTDGKPGHMICTLNMLTGC